jgi:class 3 adenylate cyclase
MATVVDSRFMLVTSVAITIWALIGDDIRLLSTSKPTDMWFNVSALVCLFYFTSEIILSCIAKDDYVMGFFFWLDVISTASLVLDLTWISDLIVGESLAEEGADRARSGRTARLGATVGRVLRIIRLIRVVKLYKALFERTNKTSNRPPPPPSSSTDDWDSIAPEEEHVQQKRQSEVGKRLVHLTTRKVIILVLTMLLVLPNLSVEDSNIIPMSAWWGADGVWDKMKHLSLTDDTTKSEYENKLLKFMYYHNWFTGNWGCPVSDEQVCPESFFCHTFWVGLAGTNLPLLEAKSALAQVRQESIETFEATAQAKTTMYYLGNIPGFAQELLSAPWDTKCTYGDVEYRGVSLLANEVSGEYGVTYAVRCPSDLRPQEKMTIYPMAGMNEYEFDDLHLVFFFDMRQFTKQEAQFSIITTLFICVVLCSASLLFSRDANEIVLHPVERMIEKVNAIRDDPLQAIKLGDADFEREERAKYKQNSNLVRSESYLQKYPSFVRRLRIMLSRWKEKKEKPGQETMETVVLERTIIKLGSLLALGFGEAGANIVAHNMQGLDTAGVNTMIPGARVHCIISNVRVDHFSLVTEVLHGQITTFVNQIAEIVHGCVNECHGATNKNNGETFLIIWRTDVEWLSRLERLADVSVLACVRITAAIQRSPLLARYRSHPALQQRLGSKYQVRLSCGLHFGWAIEGAVGSDYKIDASYLSPNVNIAEGLQRATKVYDVQVICSENVIEKCTEAVAAKCRLIDRVMIRGSKVPLQIYTMDLDPGVLEVEEFPREPLPWNLRQRFQARQSIEAQKKHILKEDLDIASIFDRERDIATMRRRFPEEFRQIFNMGYQNYSQGEWQVARRLLARTYTMLVNTMNLKDGPSGALLAFMESRQFQVPEGWQGVRELHP